MKSISKLPVSAVPPTDEVFSWNDEDGSTLHFAVTRIWEQECPKLEPVLVPVDNEFAKWADTHRGVETHRLNRICRMLMSGVVPPPVIFAAMPDGSHLLIDGVHRYCGHAIGGLKHIVAYLVPQDIWTRYLIDLPNESTQQILGTFSGKL